MKLPDDGIGELVMAKEILHVCRTCAWAEWERTPTGRISKTHAGRCTFPIKRPVLPMCVCEGDYLPPHKHGIWADLKTPCVAWCGEKRNDI